MEPLRPPLWPPRYRGEWLGIGFVLLYVALGLQLHDAADDWSNGSVLTLGFVLLYTIGTVETRPRKD